MARDLFDHQDFKNPFRPGAGHMPPYLAGRETEQNEFRRLLRQEVILENMILTGLRGVGKTVLLESLKPIAIENSWLWVGTDLSESTSISEDNIAKRLITDLSIRTSSLPISRTDYPEVGFNRAPGHDKAVPYKTPDDSQRIVYLDYKLLTNIFDNTPGLISDKLKFVLELAWKLMKPANLKGVIFAYDESQNLADHATRQQYPLSLILDIFQSVQRKEIPFMLILTGLPTLYAKLVKARTYSERMFHIVELNRLNEKDSRDAILKPIEKEDCPVRFNDESVDRVIATSAGYPYFIQFICREVYDLFIQKIRTGEKPIVPVEEIIHKLDTDFFAARWGRATDRQKRLMWVIAGLNNSDSEFSALEVAEASRDHDFKPFSPAHVHQMLTALCEAGLIYKNRHGKYSFAVPLMHKFVRRQEMPSEI